MSPRHYGTVVHEVMECLGEPHLAACTDAEVLAEALLQALEQASLRNFGPKPLPTVRLQLAQLAYRLERFAPAQALHASQGWRVEHVEWEPPIHRGTPMPVDGDPITVRGTIDRIDHNPGTGEWAILDYKTGESGKSPDAAHLSKGEWKDLQLPLYTHLVQELDLGEAPRVGYIYVGRSEDAIGFCPGAVRAKNHPLLAALNRPIDAVEHHRVDAPDFDVVESEDLAHASESTKSWRSKPSFASSSCHWPSAPSRNEPIQRFPGHCFGAIIESVRPLGKS